LIKQVSNPPFDPEDAIRDEVAVWVWKRSTWEQHLMAGLVYTSHASAVVTATAMRDTWAASEHTDIHE